MLLYTTFCFEASHSLQAPIGVPSVHGHSYWARVWIASSREQLTPLPSLETEAKRVAALLDHQHLNDLMDHQPTMEALVDYIRAQWQGPALKRVHVWRESLGCGVEWSAS
ncbi:hypothetical protein GH816_04105 [Betaproteobacteria bacterium LSUCC0115]|nr:hypothetical protein [Burkholderiales bacterium LSUCC0115]